MYFVALTRSNVNPALVFEYIFSLIKILKAYLGEDFDENNMRNNMTLIYELMDETMDFGYPQVRTRVRSQVAKPSSPLKNRLISEYVGRRASSLYQPRKPAASRRARAQSVDEPDYRCH